MRCARLGGQRGVQDSPAEGLGPSLRTLFSSRNTRLRAPTRERRYVDGALLHELGVPFGFWEAKDEEDDLERGDISGNFGAVIRKTILSSRILKKPS